MQRDLPATRALKRQGPSNLQPGAATDPLLCAPGVLQEQLGAPSRTRAAWRQALYKQRPRVLPACVDQQAVCKEPPCPGAACTRVDHRSSPSTCSSAQGFVRVAPSRAEEPTSRANNECVSKPGEARCLPVPFDGGETRPQFKDSPFASQSRFGRELYRPLPCFRAAELSQAGALVRVPLRPAEKQLPQLPFPGPQMQL